MSKQPEPLYLALVQRATVELLRRRTAGLITNRGRRDMDGLIDPITEPLIDALTPDDLHALVRESGGELARQSFELRSKPDATPSDHVRWNLRNALATELEEALQKYEKAARGRDTEPRSRSERRRRVDH